MADGWSERSSFARGRAAERVLESARQAIAGERHDVAIASLSAYLKRAPGEPAHVAALARAYLGKDAPKRAIATLRKGIAQFGAQPMLLNFLVSTAYAIGDFDLVRKTFERLERRYVTASTLAMYFNAIEFEVPEELFQLAAKALQDPRLQGDDFRQLAAAMAKAHLKRGDREAAFGCVRRLNASYPAPDPERLRRNVTCFAPGLRAEPLALQIPKRAWPPAVFIVGLPRSGSTLLSQALSAHPDAVAIGESEAAPRAVSAMIAGLGLGPQPTLAEVNEALGPEALRRLRRGYFDAVGKPEGARARARAMVIDKQLGNFRFVAFLARAFPDAAIIHAYRHPLDCLLSIMERSFGAAHAYKRDEDSLAAYFKAHQGLMDLWEQAFPGRLIQLCHEAYVEDFEATTRRLLDRLGLPFHPACLAPERNDHAVRTSSATQIRKPVNRSGFGKWRSFEEELQPLIRALGGLEAIEADYAARRARAF